MWWSTVISKYGGAHSFLNVVEHSHFKNFSQFGGTQSFLNCFLIWWDTVMSKCGGTQSLQMWWSTVISKYGGAYSFLNVVEHGHF